MKRELGLPLFEFDEFCEALAGNPRPSTSGTSQARGGGSTRIIDRYLTGACPLPIRMVEEVKPQVFVSPFTRR